MDLRRILLTDLVCSMEMVRSLWRVHNSSMASLSFFFLSFHQSVSSQWVQPVPIYCCFPGCPLGGGVHTASTSFHPSRSRGRSDGSTIEVQPIRATIGQLTAQLPYCSVVGPGNNGSDDDPSFPSSLQCPSSPKVCLHSLPSPQHPAIT